LNRLEMVFHFDEYVVCIDRMPFVKITIYSTTDIRIHQQLMLIQVDWEIVNRLFPKKNKGKL